MMLLFYILLPIYAGFCLWLGFRIIQKAGFDGWWILILLIPYVNILALWVFAFKYWPTLKEEVNQNLNS